MVLISVLDVIRSLRSMIKSISWDVHIGFTQNAGFVEDVIFEFLFIELIV